jgi:hypothetical protein
MQVLKSVPVRFLHSGGIVPRIDDVPGVVAVPALGVVLLDVCAPAIVAMPTDNAPASTPSFHVFMMTPLVSKWRHLARTHGGCSRMGDSSTHAMKPSAHGGRGNNGCCTNDHAVQQRQMCREGPQYFPTESDRVVQSMHRHVWRSTFSLLLVRKLVAGMYESPLQ